MYILGISCFYHDSAACLLHNGKVLAGCQEERVSRIKHDWQFPAESIKYCLRAGGISPKELSCVVFHEKPLLKFERIIETFLSIAPFGYRTFIETIPSWLKQKLQLPRIISKQLGKEIKLLYADHHLSHAASAYFASAFESAALLTIDGVGEWATASYGQAKGTSLQLTHEQRFPHSLGLLYSAITTFLGFKANNDEYKVMGMAPYGKPVYRDLFLNNIVTLNNDGSIRLNLDYFSFQYGTRMVNSRKMEQLFGVDARNTGGEITAIYFDIAASLQNVTETIVLRMAEHLQKKTGLRNLCLAGGVALNCVANGRLLTEGPFDDIYIQPAAGDAGGALGAAYAAYHLHYAGLNREPLKDFYLGPSYTNRAINELLSISQLEYQYMQDEELLRKVALLLSEKKIVGWFQGRMEFGPRALGNRSILADPRFSDMKDIINSKIKFREAFRPFAPVVLQEKAADYFDISSPSPYMLFTFPVSAAGIPAVTHIDGSARVQTLSQHQNSRLYSLLNEFEQLTGVPVLMNTSLNIRGEPIAMTPEDAINCFLGCGMDALVLENYLITRPTISG